jgi:hypothetical protein
MKSTALWCSGVVVGWLACFIMGIAGNKGIGLNNRKKAQLVKQYGVVGEGVS